MFVRSMILSAGVAVGLFGFVGAVRADDLGNIPPDQPHQPPPSTRPLDPNRDWGNLSPEAPPEPRKDKEPSKADKPPKQTRTDGKKEKARSEQPAVEPPTQRGAPARHDRRPGTKSTRRVPSVGGVPSVKSVPSITKRAPMMGHFRQLKSVPSVPSATGHVGNSPRFGGHRSWGGDGRNRVGIQIRQPQPPVKKDEQKEKAKDQKGGKG